MQPTMEDKISSTILASGKTSFKDGLHVRVSQLTVTVMASQGIESKQNLRGQAPEIYDAAAVGQL